MEAVADMKEYLTGIIELLRAFKQGNNMIDPPSCSKWNSIFWMKLF